MTGVEIITKERQRQVTDEGYSAEHAAAHAKEELACAAAFYALPEKYGEILSFWQFEGNPNKRSKSRIRQLAIAGAFLAAEIDRLQRLGEKP